MDSYFFITQLFAARCTSHDVMTAAQQRPPLAPGKSLLLRHGILCDHTSITHIVHTTVWLQAAPKGPTLADVGSEPGEMLEFFKKNPQLLRQLHHVSEHAAST